MKRLLMVLCALVFIAPIGADIKFDKNYEKYASCNKFYSSPIKADIDPKEYHELFLQITDQIKQLATNLSNTNERIEKEITSYLKALNSPLSLQLLQDITKNGFYANILRLSTWIIYPAHYKEKYYDAIKAAFATEKELNEYIVIMDQVLCMIITCWNNGIYGKTVHDQINSYLKSIGTPTAYHFRVLFYFKI